MKRVSMLSQVQRLSVFTMMMLGLVVSHTTLANYNVPDDKFMGLSAAGRAAAGCPVGVGGTALFYNHEPTGRALCKAHGEVTDKKFIKWHSTPAFGTWDSCGDNYLCKVEGGNATIVNGCSAGGVWTNVVVCEYQPFDCGDRWTYTISGGNDDWQLNWTQTNAGRNATTVNGTRFVCQPEECSRRICRGTNPNIVDECFLTTRGDYKRLNGTECPFCPSGEIPVVNATDSEGFTCRNAAKSITPGVVAPEQKVQIACVGLRNVLLYPGTSGPIQANQYQITVSKGGNVVYSTPWKNDFTNVDGLRVSDHWLDLKDYSDGTYNVTCQVRYPGESDIFTSTNTFEVNAQTGTSCESLQFNPEEVSVNGTTQATCRVRNAASGLRSVTTLLDSDKSPCYSSFFGFGKRNTPSKNLNSGTCQSGWNAIFGTVPTTATTTTGGWTAADANGISNAGCSSTRVDANTIRTICTGIGGDLTVKAPSEVDTFLVKAWGAGGGGGFAGNRNNNPIHTNGGAGGFAQGRFPVNANDRLTVIVGEGGKAINGWDGGNVNGFGGGANDDQTGGNISGGYGGGGGLSGVFTGTGNVGPGASARALVIAGGGGGGGGNAQRNASLVESGTSGGSNQSGGQSNMQGASSNYRGSGGGGGYRGGAVNTKQGKGGRNFVKNNAAQKVEISSGVNSFQPPRRGDTDYRNNAGRGGRNGLDGNGNNNSNAHGDKGLVVIYWYRDNSSSTTTTSTGGSSYTTDDTYARPDDISTYNVLQGFLQNGTYNNICYAFSASRHVGFTAQEKQSVPYLGVTSAACGYPNTVPIYVGESYCSNIQTPSIVYADDQFNVVCELDTTASSQPTSYEIRVNGTAVATGPIPADATTLSVPVTLAAGTQNVECLIKGPQNADYVSPSCKKTILPEALPAGSCQPGQSIANSTLCSGDSSGVGSDVPAIVVDTCTDSRKCEYQCNTGYAVIGDSCKRAATYGNVTVPSHLRPGADFPLVQCQGQPGDTHFKFQIVRNGDVTDLTCPAGATGTYPNCTCPSGGTYSLTNNTCQTVCPAGATGTYPNCTCPAGTNYDASTNTCTACFTDRFPYCLPAQL